MEIHSPLSAKERDELESLMEARNLEGPLADSITLVHGFFTSVVSGPMITPSEWIPVVFGGSDDRAWQTMDQARSAMSLLMRFYNEVASSLHPDAAQYGILVDRLGDEADTSDFADDWCKGYLAGIALREDEWKEAMEDPQLSPSFLPILAIASPGRIGMDVLDTTDRAEMLDALPKCAVEIYEWWRKKLLPSMQGGPAHSYSRTVRRTEPKIPPNAPCPCGSGKKYKRCCSPIRNASSR